FIIADQHPSLLSLPSMGDTYTTVSLFLKDAHDVDAIGAAMLMDKESKKSIGRLPVGRGIVKLSGRWFNPFLIRIPLLVQAKGQVSDEEIARIMGIKGFSPLSREERLEREYWSKRTALKVKDEKANTLKNETPETAELSTEEYQFLLDVYERPYVGLDSHYKHLERSKAKGIRIRDDLIDKGFLTLVKEKIGMNIIGLLDITEKGKVLLTEKGINIHKIPFNEGGIVHRYCVNHLKKYYAERDYKVFPEYLAGNDHYVDLMVKKEEGLPIAIEVETGKSDPIGTIKRDLAAGFNQVICIAINFDVYYQILEKTKKEELEGKVIIICIDKYLR
ncbi:MAG: hypothetical protein AB1633_13985, partial [Elusimicrobiota bacterium]